MAVTAVLRVWKPGLRSSSSRREPVDSSPTDASSLPSAMVPKLFSPASSTSTPSCSERKVIVRETARRGHLDRLDARRARELLGGPHQGAEPVVQEVVVAEVEGRREREGGEQRLARRIPALHRERDAARVGPGVVPRDGERRADAAGEFGGPGSVHGGGLPRVEELFPPVDHGVAGVLDLEAHRVAEYLVEIGVRRSIEVPDREHRRLDGQLLLGGAERCPEREEENGDCQRNVSRFHALIRDFARRGVPLTSVVPDPCAVKKKPKFFGRIPDRGVEPERGAWNRVRRGPARGTERRFALHRHPDVVYTWSDSHASNGLPRGAHLGIPCHRRGLRRARSPGSRRRRS